MSELSKALLFNSFDYQEVAHRRIENYLILSDALKNIALFPTLTKGTIPLGFPIRHIDRNKLKENLFNEQIYPPVHWDVAGSIPNNFRQSHRLGECIMTLPCDQRYDSLDMQKIISCIHKFLGKKKV